MMKDLKALLNHTHDAAHQMAIFSGTQKNMKDKSHKKMYISDVQQHPMELCIFLGIQVQVEGLEGECQSQMGWCTGTQTWHGGYQQYYWVWIKQCPGRWYCALDWRLQWQLQRLFNIKLLHEDVACIQYWLAWELTTIPENSDNSNHVLEFV